MKIGFLQTRPKFGAVKENVRSAKSLLKNITEATVVLPELFNTGYLFRSKDELQALSESAASGYTVTEMKKVAKQKKLNLVFGIAEKKGGKYFNSSVLITATGKVSVYQKTHLFDREKLFFSAGDRSYAAHPVDGAKVGMMVCFDWFFPEVTRVLALKGAVIICHPANLVMPHCQDAMRTRSIENKVFSVTANRIGTEKRGNVTLAFTGKSQVVGPGGEVLAHAGERSESLKIVEVDLEQAMNKSINPNNNLFADRKVSLYKPIASKTVR
ncbi:MAG: nitrilase-related carbon-nitrogen hydrolase [Candidatus Krumholzibacteriia bacterium]